MRRFDETWFVGSIRCDIISRCHLLFHIFDYNQRKKRAARKEQLP